MKKRSACKFLLGAVALGGLSAGHCGKVTLTGSTHTTLHGSITMYGRAIKEPGVAYSLGIGCAVCAAYSGPCGNARPSTINVVSRSHASNVRVVSKSNGAGFSGNFVEWVGSAGHETDTWVRVEYVCDNASRPEWSWVNVSYHRDRYSPRNSLYVEATNYETGVTERKDMGYGGAWRPWPAVHPGTSGSLTAVISMSYPEQVVLRGHGAKARVLYDITGNVPVYARIDQLPPGLSCTRTSDGLTIAAGVSAAVGVGDSIACANVLTARDETTGALTMTAMVR